MEIRAVNREAGRSTSSPANQLADYEDYGKEVAMPSDTKKLEANGVLLKKAWVAAFSKTAAQAF